MSVHTLIVSVNSHFHTAKKFAKSSIREATLVLLDSFGLIETMIFTLTKFKGTLNFLSSPKDLKEPSGQ